MKHGISLRGLVLGWTILTTTFVWTPTMRLLFKPQIHHWDLFGITGSGRGGLFWLLPAAVLYALLLFYIEGRGKLRPVFHILLLGWHLPITGALLGGTIAHGPAATFTGAAWGVTIPFYILLVPFLAFSVLAVLWVVRELTGRSSYRTQGWGKLHKKELALVAALMVPVFVLFWVGEGFNIWVKLAIVMNVLQWILLTDAVGPAAQKPREEAE